MNYKIFLGILATVIGIIGYVPYYKDVLSGKTKPHSFSWFGWVLLEGIGFFAQVHDKAGAGTYVTAGSTLLGLGIFVFSLKYGEKDIKTLDWLAFVAGIFGIVLWQITKNPLSAVLLIVLADILLFVPTYRKAFYKPREETLIEYFLSSVKWTVGILALQTYTLTTWLYPASLVLSNGLFVIVIAWRRKKIK